MNSQDVQNDNEATEDRKSERRKELFKVVKKEKELLVFGDKCDGSDIWPYP